MIWDKGEVVDLTPPHDILGKVIGEYLPENEAFKDMMKKSYEILKDHPINIERKNDFMSENNFSKAIKESGFSKKEIAEKIGVNPRTLTRWEREESPIPYDKALEIAKIINKNVSYLMGYMEKQDKYRSDELLIGNGKGGYTSISDERHNELLQKYNEEIKENFITFLRQHDFVISDNEIKSVLLLLSSLSRFITCNKVTLFNAVFGGKLI